MATALEPRAGSRSRPTPAADDQPVNAQGPASGTPAPHPSLLRVRRLADILLMASQRGVRLDGAQAQTYDGWVLADRQRLKQVLLNLLSNAVKYNREGTGIDLALSKGLVELMGGDVGVESVEGTGSAFWIELPPADRRVPVAGS